MFSDIPVYIQSKEPEDFSEIHHVQFLSSDFKIHEQFFKSLPAGSFIVLDDFSFQQASKKQQEKIDFLKIVNYYLRHHNITLILIIHNMYNNNLLHDILLAPHIFLSYSNLGYYIIRYIIIPNVALIMTIITFGTYYLCFRKLQERLGGKEVLAFYQEVPTQNFHFAYLNCNKNYLINKVDNLFNGHKAIMFSNKTIFVIHPKNQPCKTTLKTTLLNGDSNFSDQITDFIKSTYPKQKYLILIFNILNPYNLIDSNLFFKEFPNIHVADFCAFINNRFGKTPTTDAKFVKLCKFFQMNQIKFPKIAIKNPVAQKYVCT
ncbi:MAG: hypothetical protein WCJ72_01210 [Chryseobacterium sp.]